MDQRAHRLARDAAEWDVVIGWSTGIGIVIIRLIFLGALIVGGLIVPWIVVQVAVQLLLAAALTYGIYRRNQWAAVGLLIVWGIPYFSSWYASGRVLPPLGIIGILVWYGLYRGYRGVRALTGRQEVAPPSM
jgi:hypothetical protein